MTKKTALVAAALLLMGSSPSACKKGETPDEAVEALKKNCTFSVPAKMRDLREAYNEAFSAPDAEGNFQSYATCAAGLEAAKKYKAGLWDLGHWMDENCTTTDNLKKNQKKIIDIEYRVSLQIEDTDCESVYGIQAPK
ncbi:MAG: hypothetical protein R3B98_06005 [Hyphomonas sp.]